MTDPLSTERQGQVTVAALYRFADLDDPQSMRAALLDNCRALGIKGSLLLAREGINGTISGHADNVAQLIAHLKQLPGCADLDVKYSHAPDHPFGRMKVKVKREIVTMGVAEIDPVNAAGIHVEPADWNGLISRPGTILIDTRNDYEVAIGSFAGAINPEIASFGDFPGWFADLRAQWEARGEPAPAIAMFCTGGIRCEKSTALARAAGCEQVYHLKGGILKYLEEVPEENSLWRGNCFVFDERISVSHGLALTGDRMCAACGWPISGEEPHSCREK